MKKILFPVLLLGVILAAAVFAEDYTVESVTGKVEREVSPGKWQALVRGMVLNPATVIDTGLNAQLVLSAGGRSVTINARQKGIVENLIGGTSASGVRISEKATESEAGVSTGEAGLPGAAKDPER
ncbi:MAG: hypothetical protein LBF77_04040 [Spirochaetaceae bacterium]|jgi:hypothetical protein|nr:hypothetical protein [Spirochaetaceae bacterium]